MKFRCPICGLDVEVPDDVISGEIVEHECGAVLEVIQYDGGITLKPLEGVQEDWGE